MDKPELQMPPEFFDTLMNVINSEAEEGGEISIFVNQKLVATFYPTVPDDVRIN